MSKKIQIVNSEGSNLVTEDGRLPVSQEPPKQSYICKIIEVTADEQEYDLETIYTEFTIIVTGIDDVILKLNDNSNDEISLAGGANFRDIIGSDNFEINKIYHKTTESGKESKILIWAIK